MQKLMIARKKEIKVSTEYTIFLKMLLAVDKHFFQKFFRGALPTWKLINIGKFRWINQINGMKHAILIMLISHKQSVMISIFQKVYMATSITPQTNNPVGTKRWVPIANQYSVSAITPHKKWVPPSTAGYLQEKSGLQQLEMYLGCWKAQVCTEPPNIFPKSRSKNIYR